MLSSPVAAVNLLSKEFSNKIKELRMNRLVLTKLMLDNISNTNKIINEKYLKTDVQTSSESLKVILLDKIKLIESRLNNNAVIQTDELELYYDFNTPVNKNSI